MKPAEAEEYTQSLGQIVGGSWRQISLAKKLGVPKALGLSTEQWVRERLGGYVRMSVEDRRQAVAELAGNGESTREIEAVLGVDHSTVARDVANATGGGSEIKGLTDGSVANATEPIEAIAAIAAVVADATTSRPHVANNSGENEWYTPARWIAAARATMGGIDTDPASSELANRTVGASVFYSAEDDGRAQQWSGRVWMNPPYAQPLIAEFAEAVTSKFESAEIEQACVLVNNATETQWFQRMLGVASAVCFPRSRIKFIDADGNATGAPLQGQAVIYMGPNVAAFRSAFEPEGVVLAWLREAPT